MTDPLISMTDFTLPKIRDEIDPKNYHIDGTPDGNYAIRILQFYRELARCKWDVSCGSERLKTLYDTMNEHQDMRATELDAAIRVLQQQNRGEDTVE